jgi:tetratricopeptide (TPR) repeat protein
VAVQAAKQAYTREQARRMAEVSERQLKSWQEQKFLPASAHFGFEDIVAMRTLVKLRRSRVPPLQIRRVLTALGKKLSHIENPLTDLKLYVDGKRVRVEVDGKAMEAESGQLILNFNQTELRRLLEFPGQDKAALDRERRGSAERWFQKGLELEQTGAPGEQIIEAYQKAIELDPNSAGALVNLGTIFFNARDWMRAKRYYEQALEVDPKYALAHFDLANLFDERGDRGKAIEHYHAAIKIAPNYADAHYNLALLYQSSNRPLKAVHHWSSYLKLDPQSDWAHVARRELAKARQSAVVPGARPMPSRPE